MPYYKTLTIDKYLESEANDMKVLQASTVKSVNTFIVPSIVKFIMLLLKSYRQFFALKSNNKHNIIEFDNT